jgi:hypothetical protein
VIIFWALPTGDRAKRNLRKRIAVFGLVTG